MADDIDHSLKTDLDLFLDKVPVLCLLGKFVPIDSKLPFDVDDNVQLVCKYLRAYSNGTIDKLYLTGNILFCITICC